jgi:cytochrome c oxidase subunit I
MTATSPARAFTCVVTGFKVDRPGRNLTMANAVAGVVMLAAAGTMALLIALQRLEAVPISNELWYRLIASHGTTALLFWLLFFEVAALYFGSTVLLNAPMRLPKVAWTAFGMKVVGMLLAQYGMFFDEPVMFTAYPPLETTPLYYLGILLFAVGVLIAIVLFFVNVVGAKRDGHYTGSLPLVTYGIAVAAIIGVYSLATGAIAYGALFLGSLGAIETIDPAVYRLFFWGIGHGAQQVNLAAMVAVWYALAGLTVGARPVNEGLSRFAFLLLLAFIHLGATHHLLVDPGIGTSHRIMNTSYLLYLAVLASLIHAFSIPAAVEVGQRERGFNKGLFGWLKHGPWREPGFSALVLSLALFGFFAGVTGVLMGYMQLNMLIHNTLFVPGHFHGTVVIGTTTAFMGIAYYLVPLLMRKPLASVKIARWQPYVFVTGVFLLMMGMLQAGQGGVPRRVADLSYSAAPITTDQFVTGTNQIAMHVVLLGAILAVTGGAMFVWVMVMTLLSKREGRVDDDLDLELASMQLRGEVGAPAPHGAGPAAEPAPAEEGAAAKPKWWERFEAPGTFVLVMVFLAWFVVMYLLAHVNLSQLWPVS